MRYKNIAGGFFGLVTKHACDGQTDRQTDGQTVYLLRRIARIITYVDVAYCYRLSIMVCRWVCHIEPRKNG